MAEYALPTLSTSERRSSREREVNEQRVNITLLGQVNTTASVGVHFWQPGHSYSDLVLFLIEKIRSRDPMVRKVVNSFILTSFLPLKMDWTRNRANCNFYKKKNIHVFTARATKSNKSRPSHWKFPFTYSVHCTLSANYFFLNAFVLSHFIAQITNIWFRPFLQFLCKFLNNSLTYVHTYKYIISVFFSFKFLFIFKLLSDDDVV